MNLIFSSRSQYWGPTGRPPLGSWSKIKSRSSDFPSRAVDDLMKGTDDRDRKSEAYRGRYTWVCMSTKSFLDAMGETKMDDQRPHGGEMSLLRLRPSRSQATAKPTDVISVHHASSRQTDLNNRIFSPTWLPLFDRNYSLFKMRWESIHHPPSRLLTQLAQGH